MLVTKFSINKSKRCTTAWLNLRTIHSMQFFTYKVMSENSGLTHAKECDACSLWKDVPLHNFLTYMDVFAWKCPHRTTCLHTTCHTIFYVELDRHVSTQCVYYETYSCACSRMSNISTLPCSCTSSHTKRHVQSHFFSYMPTLQRNPLTLTLTLTLGVGVRVGIGVGLWLVYFVLKHEVFREAGLRSRDKILCFDWSPPLLVEELACRHVGQDKLFFKSAACISKVV